MKGKKIIGGVALGLLGLGVVGGSLYGSVEAIKDYKETEALKQNGLVKKDKLSVSNTSNLSVKSSQTNLPTRYYLNGYLQNNWFNKIDRQDGYNLKENRIYFLYKSEISSNNVIYDKFKEYFVDVSNYITILGDVGSVINKDFTSGYYMPVLCIKAFNDVFYDIDGPGFYDSDYLYEYNSSITLDELQTVNEVYGVGEEIEIGGDVGFDSLNFKNNVSEADHGDVYYSLSSYALSLDTYPQAEKIKEYLEELDHPILITIDGSFTYFESCDVLVSATLLHPYYLIDYNGKTYDFNGTNATGFGIYDPAEMDPSYISFEVINGADPEESEITGIHFYEIGALKEIDYQAPTIDGTNNIVVNVNNMDSIETILSHVSASDETDGKVDVKYETEGTTYNPSNKKVGEFIIKAYAEDSSGNRTNVDITVIVADIDKPTISGTNSYTVSYDTPKTLEEVKSVLTTKDNYDSGLTLELVEDNYTGHERELGSHTIKFKTTDSSGNESEIFTVTITVEDKKAPVIGGAGDVKVANNAPIDLETFKSKFSANDDLEGSVEITISGFDTYLANQSKVGTYKITLTAKDSSGNTVTKDVNLIVEDKIAPEILLDNYFIVLNEGEELTPEQIKEMASKVLGISAESIVEVSGEYDTNVAGAYKLSVKTITGETYSINLEVNANYDDTTQYRDLKWYEYLYLWFSIFFNFQEGYTTDSFWDFSTRCAYISEVYGSGKIKVTEKVETPVEEVKCDVQVNSHNYVALEQADLQSINYEAGHIYLIPKGTYENDGSEAVLINDKVNFIQRYGSTELNNMILNDWDAVLVLKDSIPSDMYFTSVGVPFYQVITNDTYSLSDFGM